MLKTKYLGIEHEHHNFKMFHELFWLWFAKFDLPGLGLIVGYQNEAPIEGGSTGNEVKKTLKEKFNSIEDIHSLDLEGADINYDLTVSGFSQEEYNWIICQGFLEHVIDPVATMKNLRNSLIPGGKLYLHTAGLKFKYHAFPIDCFRFHEDVFYKWEILLNIKMIDIDWHHKHCFVLYER